MRPLIPPTRAALFPVGLADAAEPEAVPDVAAAPLELGFAVVPSAATQTKTASLMAGARPTTHCLKLSTSLSDWQAWVHPCTFKAFWPVTQQVLRSGAASGQENWQ